MTTDLLFDFQADRDNHALTVNREFAARRQMVWDCYTKSELLDRWFAPKPLTTKTKHMDFREGGYWHYAMIDPNGQAYWARFDYLTIRPIEHYTTCASFSDETGTINPHLPKADWDVTFIEASDRTFVRTVVSYGSTEALDTVIQMGMQEGLTSTLERLDELLADL